MLIKQLHRIDEEAKRKRFNTFTTRFPASVEKAQRGLYGLKHKPSSYGRSICTATVGPGHLSVLRGPRRSDPMKPTSVPTCVSRYPKNVSPVRGRRVLRFVMAEGTWTPTGACEPTLKLTADQKGSRSPSLSITSLSLSLSLAHPLSLSRPRLSLPLFLTPLFYSTAAAEPGKALVCQSAPRFRRESSFPRRGVTPSSRWMSLIRIIVSAIYVVAQVLLALRPSYVEGQWWRSSPFTLITLRIIVACLCRRATSAFPFSPLCVDKTVYVDTYRVVSQFRKLRLGYSAWFDVNYFVKFATWYAATSACTSLRIRKLL